MTVFTASGGEVARVSSAADGRFVLHLAAGSCTIVPNPVPVLLGTAQPQRFEATAQAPVLDIAYDTGIR